MGSVQSERSTSSKKHPLIFDATPLIYLCKVNLSNYLKELGDIYKLCTVPEVYQEVYVKGAEYEVVEIDQLKALFDEGVIMIVKREKNKKTRELLKSAGLHSGEIAVLEAAELLGGTAVVDDKRARTVGESIGLNRAGSVTVIIEFVKRKMISKSQAIESIDRMTAEGWYCSAKDYARISKAIESS